MSGPSGADSYAVPPTPITTQTTAGPVEHTDSGTGPVLLPLHGGLGGYDQSWLLARALLRNMADRRVLGLSRPGYLGTAQSLGRTPEAQADLYSNLLDALGIERALVAAVSAGGPSAIQFALRHPDRCAGLILVSTATGPLETAADFLARLRKMAWISRVPLPGHAGATRRRSGGACLGHSRRCRSGRPGQPRQASSCGASCRKLDTAGGRAHGALQPSRRDQVGG